MKSAASCTLDAVATRPKQRNLGRLSEIAQVAVRHGFGYAIDGRRTHDPAIEGTARGRHLREMLDELGPTFVKFGQLLSTRPDIVPPDIIAELRGLQDDVRPFPFADVERTIAGGARPDGRASLHGVRRAAARRRVDRPGAPRDAAERQARRRQGAAAERAAPDRGRPRADVPGGAPREGTRARARLHRRQRDRRRVLALDPAGARLPARRHGTPTRSTTTSPATRTSPCRRSTGRTRARAC